MRGCRSSQPSFRRHSANASRRDRGLAAFLVEECFDFDRSFADPMSLIPMHLRQSNGPVGQLHSGQPLQFSPATRAIALPKLGQVSNASANRDDFHVRDLTDNLEGQHRTASCPLTSESTPANPRRGNHTPPRYRHSTGGCSLAIRSCRSSRVQSCRAGRSCCRCRSTVRRAGFWGRRL